MSDSVPHNHPIDEEHDGNYPTDEANDGNTAQQESVLDQHPSLALGNDNSIMEVVQRTSTLSLSMERNFQHRHTTSAIQVTTKAGRENTSQSKLNAQPPPGGIMPKNGRDSVYQNTASSTHKNVSVLREASVCNGRFSQQEVFVRGRGGSVPRAARFQADATRRGIRTSTRETAKLAVKGHAGPPSSSSRPAGRGGSALVGRVTPHRYSERIIQGTPPVVRNSKEGCSSAATPDIVKNSRNNTTDPSKKQQQGRDRDKSTLALAISALITDTVPRRRRPLLMHIVFLSLNEIWHDTWVKLGPSRGRHLLSMRFSRWGRVYFSSVICEVRADEEEEVMILLKNVFCVIAQQLAECMKLVGMEKGGADWSVIDAFLEEAEEDETEIGNDKEIFQEIEDQRNTENMEGNEQTGGGAKKDQVDEKDEENEENEGLGEVEQQLNPLFESLKSQVEVLECLNSTMVMGSSPRR